MVLRKRAMILKVKWLIKIKYPCINCIFVLFRFYTSYFIDMRFSSNKNFSLKVYIFYILYIKCYNNIKSAYNHNNIIAFLHKYNNKVRMYNNDS